jgi:hypothetical protein
VSWQQSCIDAVNLQIREADRYRRVTAGAGKKTENAFVIDRLTRAENLLPLHEKSHLVTCQPGTQTQRHR